MTNDEIKDHYNRLSQTTKAVLELSPETRMQKARSEVWIPYPAAKRVLDRLEELYAFPKRNRMPNMVLSGETNNGKTSILNRFISKYPIQPGLNGTIIPIIHISAPVTPSHNALYEKILDFLKVPYRINDTASRKEYQVIHTLEVTETKMIIIDEFQDVLHGRTQDQDRFHSALKHMGSQLQIPIVVAGVHEVKSVMLSNAQMANRFEPEELPLWGDNKEFAMLLSSFERTLPLKLPSYIHQLPLRSQILQMSEGILGEVSTILQRATILAIENKKEYIDSSILDNISYTSPSDRHKS